MSKTIIIILLTAVCLLASGRADAQKGGGDGRNLQEQVALLIDDVHEKGLISMGLKDSINRFVTDSSMIRTDRDYDKMVALRNYIMRSLKSPNIYNEMTKSIQPETIDAPMSKDCCISKGVEGFYKNDRGMKFEGAGWPDQEAANLAAERAMASVSQSLANDYPYRTPAFINELSSSNNFFLKILGGMLKAFDNGAKAGSPVYGR